MDVGIDSSPQEIELDKVCRGCLGKKGEMRSLFGACLDEMLRNVAEVQVDISDGLPSLMCFQCVLQVSRAFRFKQQCQKSDATLRSCLADKYQKDNAHTESVETTDASLRSNPEDCLLLLQPAECDATASEENATKDYTTICDSSIMNDPFPLLNEHAIISDFNLKTEVPVASSIFSECIDQTENTEEGRSDNECVKIGAGDPVKPVHKNSILPFQCSICSKTFAKGQILRRHLKIHNPVKPHVCKDCGMSFTESSNLTKHRKKHTGELRNVIGKPNLCTVCGKAFKWASSLSKHMNHHTKRKVLNCPHCPKYYLERQTLKLHIRTHTGERPFVCNICEKSFTQMCNLEKHLRIHTGEKPYVCPVCKKRFTQSSYIAIHMRSHTGEKPYMCNECGKCFAGSNTLAMHKRTHTGERPYCCNICGKNFARLETATVHQRTHTGEKPHYCTICNRAFISSSHLSNHKRTHINSKTYECEKCGRKYSNSTSFKNHIKSPCPDLLLNNICNPKGFATEPHIIPDTILVINSTEMRTHTNATAEK